MGSTAGDGGAGVAASGTAGSEVAPGAAGGMVGDTVEGSAGDPVGGAAGVQSSTGGGAGWAKATMEPQSTVAATMAPIVRYRLICPLRHTRHTVAAETISGS
ncbi:hypothetical protein PA7_47970 [Pseudonocardia asaccharolytica DSM 44247 = NBRC 16224]|uniref:Uncharacterized protein n=1 Tax=Pseudonocardia asaccharolytica DSM 44247 = NBRC 16224 TaxID=1123024 RepID=A0A511D830_9PSEU|nr:hypothetical protein PA7_47970 [Pseudonocardia asaccharolytica DSM 44247 = NBRC 16224]